MESHGIDKALISNAACSSSEENIHYSAAEGLAETLAFAKAHPGRIYVAPWIKPIEEPSPTERLLTLMNENRSLIKAIKFHPYCERLPIDDPRLLPYLELARSYNLPILVHTAVDADSSIGHLVNAAKANPDLRFVAAHMELCSNHEYAINALKDLGNVSVDTAWVDLYHAIQAMDVLGKHRVFFGTDSPIEGKNTLDNPVYQDYLSNAAGLNEEDYFDLMGRAGMRFYDIPE